MRRLAFLCVARQNSVKVSASYLRVGSIFTSAGAGAMEYETENLQVRVQDMVTIVRFRAVYLTPADYVEELTDALDTMVDDGTRLLVLDFKNVEEGCPELIDMLRHLQVRLKELNG